MKRTFLENQWLPTVVAILASAGVFGRGHFHDLVNPGAHAGSRSHGQPAHSDTHSPWEPALRRSVSVAKRPSQKKKAARNSRLVQEKIYLLSGFFGYQGAGGILWSRVQNAHLLPVVGEFLAAIKTHYVSPDARRGLVAARSSTNSHWKTVARMPASEHGIHHSGEHDYLPTPGRGGADTRV